MADLHAIEPVTIERLAQLCELIDADYAIIEAPLPDDADVAVQGTDGEAARAHRVLQTGVPHIAVHCDVDEEGETLSAFATWEGTLPASAEEEVAAAVAEINWASVAPTLSYLAGDNSGEADGSRDAAASEIQLCANRAMAVGEGLSLAQLGQFLLSSLASFAEVFDVVAQRFPQAVTWNDDGDVEGES